MYSVLDPNTRTELISRIRALDQHSTRLWGKMTLPQMLRHCVLCEKYYLGEIKVKRHFLGRLIGALVLKKILKDDSSFPRNARAPSPMIASETDGDIEAEKKSWIHYIDRYAYLPRDNFTHWFFGKMTPEQVGQFVYKHTDHHLRQFSSLPSST